MIIKNKGFTLIELMITVLIVGILASIAVPAYRDYVLRAQLTEGISEMANMRTKLEQYFQDNRTYVGACETGTLAPLPTGLKNFALSCSNLGTDTYQITATGSDFTYTVDESNNKATTAVPDKWPLKNNCWVISKAGDCQ